MTTDLDISHERSHFPVYDKDIDARDSLIFEMHNSLASLPDCQNSRDDVEIDLTARDSSPDMEASISDLSKLRLPTNPRQNNSSSRLQLSFSDSISRLPRAGTSRRGREARSNNNASKS